MRFCNDISDFDYWKLVPLSCLQPVILSTIWSDLMKSLHKVMLLTLKVCKLFRSQPNYTIFNEFLLQSKLEKLGEETHICRGD
jgi:hypothetical protein